MRTSLGPPIHLPNKSIRRQTALETASLRLLLPVVACPREMNPGQRRMARNGRVSWIFLHDARDLYIFIDSARLNCGRTGCQLDHRFLSTLRRCLHQNFFTIITICVCLFQSVCNATFKPFHHVNSFLKAHLKPHSRNSSFIQVRLK